MTIYERGEGIRFFIVGSARSGTTLLRLMLNAHPEVDVPPESRFITEFYRGDTVEVDRFLAELSGHPRFKEWDLPIDTIREEIPAVDKVPYVSAVNAVYAAHAQVNGKVVIGDKTPRYVENIPLLAKLYPGARFVHLVRDGRNVTLSYANVPFGPKSVEKAAALWARRVTAGIRDGRTLPGARYIEMRYEDLVEDAEGEIKSLCDFIEIDFDPGMLDYTERARRAVLPRAAQYNRSVTEGIKRNVRSWETDMPESHVELFEAVAGETLSQLGYERRFPRPSGRARLKARLVGLGLPGTKIASRS